jgi:hypothetical protein
MTGGVAVVEECHNRRYYSSPEEKWQQVTKILPFQ